MELIRQPGKRLAAGSEGLHGCLVDHNKQMMDALSREDIRDVGDITAGPVASEEDGGFVVVVRFGIRPTAGSISELGLLDACPDAALLPAKSAYARYVYDM